MLSHSTTVTGTGTSIIGRARNRHKSCLIFICCQSELVLPILHRYCSKQPKTRAWADVGSQPSSTSCCVCLDTSSWGFTDEYERSDTALKEHLEKQKLIFAGWLTSLLLEQEWWFLKSYCCLGVSWSNFWSPHSGVWWVDPGWHQTPTQPLTHPPPSPKGDRAGE